MLRLPGVERRRADPALPAQIRGFHSALVLLQNLDNLLFRVPALVIAVLPLRLRDNPSFP
jgi:hypothetical protein